MCGLIALVAPHAGAQAVDAVTAAARLMRHRGPDDAGLWHDDQAVLAFQRLAVIDIAGSHQPLHWGPPESPDRYVMAFNGEVYNYRELRAELATSHGATFRTQGDAEVVAAACHFWGEDAWPRLRGMFALALWDTEARTLLCARDPFGIKPLFMATGPGGTVVGSEEKSLTALAPLLGLDLSLDARALQHYATLQYVPEPETLHQGVRRLPPGCTALLRPGHASEVRRYFAPRFHVQPFRPGDEQARYDEVASALEDSVARHMVADVTVGAFLSGGIDSTAIAALAMRHNPRLITFTAGFEQPGFSEVELAAASARAIGARHVVRMVSAEAFVQALPQIVWHLDEPIADASLVPLYFVAQAARQHVKVVLSGEGADELFGGYPIYGEGLSLRPFDALPLPVRRGIGRFAERLPQGLRGKGLLQRGALPLEARNYGNARNFTEAQLQALLPGYDPAWTHADITAPFYAESRGWDPAARMQHLDLCTWLPGDILAKADKMTMAHALELRVPFLDPAVFAVAARLPHDQKIAHGTTKYALRQALARIVPAPVRDRPKLGFPVPLAHWLREGPLTDSAHDLVAASGAAGHLIHLPQVRAWLAEHRRGEADHSRRLWTALVFLLWHAVFVERSVQPRITEPPYPLQV
ncbi:asparagine synthase (glutamine-hydrolyzing) [Ramlibacter sp.]|uniref:asparagine synthase (glutamine-hydrolyzing) n=1 Tax=Ramlibacter sp. TaxID=1917967 RepID=UPI0035B2BB26